MNERLRKSSIVSFIITSFIITIFDNLDINWKINCVIIPFTCILISYLILLKDSKNLNYKALYLLIPIILILLSGFTKLDKYNPYLNILALLVLLPVFFITLTNKNYKIDGSFPKWIFNLFPKGLITNLKYLKKDRANNKKSNVMNIFSGIVIGSVIGSVILSLLMSADDYFSHFIFKIKEFLSFDFDSILTFIFYFIILFSVFVNIIIKRNNAMRPKTYKKFDNPLIITVLSIINIVFVLFLISEITKITGIFLKLPSEYTYSSYAREGFFQLLFVTLINFTLILFLLYKTKVVENNKTIKKLLILLIVFQILLIFNSYYRMFLYIGNYGFTTLRLQVILFLLMELIIFIILINRVLKKIKDNDGFIYFIIMISFYVLNLYLCSSWFIKIIL